MPPNSRGGSRGRMLLSRWSKCAVALSFVFVVGWSCRSTRLGDTLLNRWVVSQAQLGIIQWTNVTTQAETEPLTERLINQVQESHRKTQNTDSGLDVFRTPCGKLKGTPIRQGKLNLRVFGFYNTGTNLLVTIFGRMFPTASVCPRGETLKTCRYRTTDPHIPESRVGFKHNNPHYVREWLTAKIKKPVRIAFIVRNPMSHLASIHKRPYGLMGCAESADWLTKNCSCAVLQSTKVDGFLMGKNDRLCTASQVSLGTIAQIWNTYARSYWQMSNSSHATLLRYEDLILHPAETMRCVASALALVLPANFTVEEIVHDKVKKQGLGMQEAREKIESRAYRRAYTSEDVNVLCQQLDKEMLAVFGYASECV